MGAADRHSEYLAKALAALTPEGRARVDELLEELAEAAGNHAAVVGFATARELEADLGRTGLVSDEEEPARMLTEQELAVVKQGFKTIRDQEHLEDVANWANAVLALLADDGARPPT